MPRSLLYIILGLILVLISNIFKPVPIVAESEALEEKGIVENIYETGDKDITFILKGNNNSFYINRGIEKGLNVQDLKVLLKGKEVILKYPDYKNVFSRFAKKRSIHISKVQFEEQVLYNELLDH